MSAGHSLIGRRRGSVWLRSAIFFSVIILIWVQISILSFSNSSNFNTEYNETSAAILSMVPAVLHKFLTPKHQNTSNVFCNKTNNQNTLYRLTTDISEIKKNIAQYNLQQTVYNEDIFGPLQNDSVVIVIQVSFS